MVFSFAGPWPWQGPPRATLQQRSAADEPRPRARAVQGRLSSSSRLQCTALAKGQQRLRPLFQPGRLGLLGLSTASAVVLVEAGSRRQRRPSTRGATGLFVDKQRRCTDVLLSLNVAAYAAQVLSRGALLSWGAKVNQLIAVGQLWRLVTPALLHGGLLHLFVNCYSLNDLGPAAERLLGPRRFPCLYVASAVSGNVASYLMNPGPGVGASGAIFGLVGCLAVYFARHRRLYGRAGELKLEALTRVMVLNLTLGAMSPNIDNWAHLGGLAGGALVTFVCGPNLVWERGRLVDRPLLRI